MMKKTVLALGAACVATVGIYAASDRIDVYNKAGEFTSVMVDHIQEMTVGKDAGQEGFTTLNISTAAGQKSIGLAGISEIIYSPVVPSLAHEISIKNAENASVRLLDWRNNTDVWGEAQIDPTKPADWRGCWADGNPHFLIDTDKGFASEFTVTGKYTNNVYTDNPNFIFWSLKEFNLLGVDSYSFDMPFEPVEIAAVSFELDTYRDAPFIGDYKGYGLTPENKRISSKAESVMSVHFDANTTYRLTSTDSHGFDVLDLYTWNEEKNTIAYVPYEGDMRSPLSVDIWDGIVGKFADGGVLFATIHKIYDDKPDNNVRYFAVRDEGEVSVASADIYYQKVLVQYDNGQSVRYFYYPEAYNYPVEGTMEWTYGNSIDDDCQGFFVSEDGKLFKFTHTPDAEPVFVYRGFEYGTFTGNGAALSLDGFEDCTLGDAAGKYTVEGGVVKVTIGSETRIFVIDTSNHTYTEMDAGKWTGQSHYTLETATASFRGGELSAFNTMIIDIDKDFSGNDAPGVASVRFTIKRTDGFSGSDGIADDGKYIYDAVNKTLKITNIYMGTSAHSSGRSTITMKVSDDMLSMWVDDSESDYLYVTGNTGSYFVTGPVNTLTAPAPAASITLAAEYTGAPNMLAFGNPAATDTKLTIDAAASKATLLIKGMGTPLLNATVDYTLEGSVLTLVGVPTLADATNPFGATVPTDLVFNVSDGGATLTGTQTIAVAASGMAFDVDLTSAPLTAAE